MFNFLNNRYIKKIAPVITTHLIHGLYYIDAYPKESSFFVLSFDIDYEEDVKALPEVVEILRNYNIKAVFACVGKWIEQYPDIHMNLVKNGHEIVNHSWSHPYSEVLNPISLNALSDKELIQEVVKTDKIIREVLKYIPLGFRTPHFGPQHEFRIYKILHDFNYKYSSSILYYRNNYLKLKKIDLLEFPLAVVPNTFHVAFDSWNYFERPRKPLIKKRDIIRDFEILIKGILATRRGYGSIYLDPSSLIRYFHIYKEFFEILNRYKEKGLKISTYEEIIKE